MNLLLKNIFLFLSLLFYTGCSFKNPFIPPEIDSVHYEEEVEPISSESMYRATMKPYVVFGKKYHPTTVKVGDKFRGIASWYGEDFHGKLTSNGERYNMHSLTAAHKTLPINTVVRVTNLHNNKSVDVRINDRGPFVKDRIIDLSNRAAYKIDMVKRGIADVEIEVLHFDSTANKYQHKKKSVWKNFPQKDDLSQELKVVSGGKYMVQVGSFNSKEKAKLFSKRCYNDNSRYTPLIKEIVYDNQKVYRVVLSGFKSIPEARDFINRAGYDGAFVVRD